MPSVRIGYISVLLDYFEAKGLDPVPVLGGEWVDSLRRATLGERVSVTLYADIMMRAITAFGDEALPLKLAEFILPRHLGILGVAISHCSCLGETAQLLQRYERLVDDINDTRLSVSATRASIEWIPRIENPAACFMQKSLAVWVTFARRISGRGDLVADASFPFPAPDDIRPYSELFGGDIRFGQPLASLSFDVRYLALPVQTYEQQTHALLLQQLQCCYESEVEADNYLDHVRQIIRRSMSQGQVSLECIASVLKLTPRSLQNRLRAQGYRFRDLLEEERFRMAQAYLRDPTISLAEVAFLLGYSEQSPFQNAFKRRFGITPGEFRRQSR